MFFDGDVHGVKEGNFMVAVDSGFLYKEGGPAIGDYFS